MALNKGDLISMYEEKSQGYDPKFLSQILIPTGRGNVAAARDYIQAICKLTMLERYKADKSMLHDKADIKKFIPPHVRFRLNAYTPMLAARYDELKKPQQDALFDNKKYLFTTKENGVRLWIVIAGGKIGMFSRNYSDEDCRLLDYHENVYQYPKFDSSVTFAIDVEVKYEPDTDLVKTMAEYGMETESKLEAMSALLQTYPETACEIQKKYKEATGKDLIVFRLIHPLYFEGKNYVKRKLGEGKLVYDKVVEYAQSIGLNVKPIQMCNGSREEKMAFLDGILSSYGEGVVVHNLDAFYSTSENRDKDGFIKIKRSVGAGNGTIGDSIDAFVTGFKMADEKRGNAGIIGALEVSSYIIEDDGTLNQAVVATVSNIPLELKKAITIVDPVTGEVSMRKDMYGKVMVVTGQNFSARSEKLSHARILQVGRLDKSPEDCIISRQFIRANSDLNY